MASRVAGDRLKEEDRDWVMRDPVGLAKQPGLERATCRKETCSDLRFRDIALAEVSRACWHR